MTTGVNKTRRSAVPNNSTPRDLRRAGTFVHPDDFRDAVPGPTMAYCVLIARRSAGGRNQLQAVALTRLVGSGPLGARDESNCSWAADGRTAKWGPISQGSVTEMSLPGAR